MIIPNIENLRILSNNVFDDTAQNYIESVVNTISEVLANPSNSIIRAKLDSTFYN